MTTTNQLEPPSPIAQGEGTTFWLIAGEVYRAQASAALDTFGHPMGKRWECSHAQWMRFREVYSWAEDLPSAHEHSTPLAHP